MLNYNILLRRVILVQIAQLLVFLILFPLIAAFFLLIARKDLERIWIVKLSALAIGLVSVYLLVTTYDKGMLLVSAIPAEPTGLVMFILEMLIAGYILYLGITHKRWLVVGLILAQSVMMLYFELVYSHSVHIQANLFSDELSIIMALIIGIIGSLICVYSLGYMKSFHESHPGMPDKRPWFFAIIFLFLSGMFGLVFSNNIIWVYFFWEITTLCSFLLIGYTKTEEATNNAFLALWMNLLGGIAFAGAIIWLAMFGNGMMGLDALTTSGKVIALIPAAFIGFAGLTKAAQFPFSGWLVGAMVAPTPVSALLHSSTMVKAGVYILVRFAPVFDSTVTGYMIAMVGALTFLIASGIAVSQPNAKRVLAYSTIANLGLIVACAGIGTYEAIWAAILLIVFHAISKSLLFLATGTVEHRIKSREIDDMNGLIVRMPKIAAMMVIGIAGMFLLPFGMLISKWAAIRAFIDAPYGFLFIIILAFGSALTLFFWSKWMGKIIAVTNDSKNIEGEVDKSEWTALTFLAGLTFITTLLFPMLSTHLLEPFLMTNYGHVAQISQDNIIIMILMLLLLMVMPLSVLIPGRKPRHLDPYMCGRPTTHDMRFDGSLGVQKKMVLSNYYLQDWLGEKKLKSWGIWICSAMICIMVLSAVFRGVIP